MDQILDQVYEYESVILLNNDEILLQQQKNKIEI